MKRFILLTSILAMTTSCASVAPRQSIEDQFVDFGFNRDRAACLADELQDRLDRDDLSDLADYISGLNSVDTPRQALDALLRIENPRAVAAIGPAGLSCALGG